VARPLSVPTTEASTSRSPGRATVARLPAQGVAGAIRGGAVRLAVHFYNDEDDIERVARALT
jgi:selenocysteine lyase/cysteine desulfurase